MNIRVDLACTVLLSLTFSDSAELKVTLIAPEGSPRVLDEPVLGAPGDIALAVANDCDSVVHILDVRAAAVAVTIVYDTIRVASKA